MNLFYLLFITLAIFSCSSAFLVLKSKSCRSASASSREWLDRASRFTLWDSDGEVQNETETETERKGKQRRALRAIAARMIQQEVANPDNRSLDRLETMQVKMSQLKEKAFVRNVEETLRARELVKLKVLGSGLKKKDVKQAGMHLTGTIPTSEVVQVVGHTMLIWLPGDGIVNKLLLKELST